MTRFLWPGFDSSRKLSTEEAVELAARVAELTKAGLPLGGGLRALSVEMPGRRLPGVLRAMADRLDAGADLAAAIDAEGRRLPPCLRGLVLAGLHTGRLAEVLEEYADLQRKQLEIRRRIWLALAYPLLLLAMLALLAVFSDRIVVRMFFKIFQDFGTKLPALTLLVLKISGPAAWFFWGLFLAFLGLAIAIRFGSAASWGWPALRRIPLIGPLLRWGYLSQFSRLMGMALEQRVPLPDAMRLTASGLGDAGLARDCLQAADEIEHGRPLDESLAARRQFPDSLIPIVEWGQKIPALDEAFRAAAEMFEGRIRTQGTLLEALLLPIVLLVIMVSAGMFVVAMMLPMISLIQCLSGPGG